MKYQKAENVQKFFERVYKVFDRIKKQYPNKTILIVSHAGVVKALECYANGMLDDEDIGPFLPDNAVVLQYDI